MKKRAPEPLYPWPEGNDPHAPDDWRVSIEVVGNSFKTTVTCGFLEQTPARYPRSLARAQRIGARLLRRRVAREQRTLRKRIELAASTKDWSDVPPRYRPGGVS